MRLSIKQSKLSYIALAIVFAATVYGTVAALSFYKPVIAWFVFFLLVSIPRFEFKGSSVLSLDFLLPGIASVVVFYFSSLINMVGHEYFEDEKYVWLFIQHSDRTQLLAMAALTFAIYYALRVFNIPRRVSGALAPFFPLLLSLVNYFVYQFRGQEFMAADISGTETAMNVAGNYEYNFYIPFTFLILPYLLWFIFCLRIKEEKSVTSWYIKSAINACFAVITGITFVSMVQNYTLSNDTMAYGDEGSRFNGFLMNFSMSVDLLFPTAPAGYSGNDYFNSYQPSVDYNSETNETANIIVIMNESYVDPDMFFDNLNGDPDPYWDGLTENTIHGVAASSVYGGRTPNSEFEFLTSITTAFLPANTIPYSMYIDEPIPSIVQYLNNQGYITTAMHPYLESGWRRTHVYPNIGFQNMQFINDFDISENNLIREYVSDLSAYEHMLDYIDSLPEDQNSFTFLVTMQNHGGYTTAYDNFNVDNYLSLENSDDEFKLNNYISLVHQSDIALEYLIDELSQREERYVVLIFGDHQPSLPYMGSSMGLCGSATRVPYLLWTNYDMPEEAQYDYQSDSTGLCYLALDVLNAAGLELPAYYQYISDIRDVIPAINATGYYSSFYSSYRGLDDDNPANEQEALNSYRYLQYNILFDEADNILMNGVMPD